MPLAPCVYLWRWLDLAGVGLSSSSLTRQQQVSPHVGCLRLGLPSLLPFRHPQSLHLLPGVRGRCWSGSPALPRARELSEEWSLSPAGTKLEGACCSHRFVLGLCLLQLLRGRTHRTAMGSCCCNCTHSFRETSAASPFTSSMW